MLGSSLRYSRRSRSLMVNPFAFDLVEEDELSFFVGVGGANFGLSKCGRL